MRKGWEVLRFKSGVARQVEKAAWLLDGAIGLGLVSGAAVAAVLGQFLLGGVLALLAVGVFLRFKRGRLRSQDRRAPPT